MTVPVVHEKWEKVLGENEIIFMEPPRTRPNSPILYHSFAAYEPVRPLPERGRGMRLKKLIYPALLQNKLHSLNCGIGAEVEYGTRI